MSSKIIFSLISLLVLTQTVKAETIILTADKWCPFNCEPGSSKMGYMVDVAKVIFERKGHNIDYQVNPWIKSIDHVRHGRATALVATTKPDAPDLIYPEKSMGSNKDCFYVRAQDKWEYNSLVDLKDRKVGIAEAYAYSPALSAYFSENPRVTTVASGNDPLRVSLQRLDQKSIDTIVENPFVFNYVTSLDKIRDKYEEAGCTDDNDLYIAFSPKNPRSKEFAKMLSDGIEELRKDGTLDKIIAKYSLKDWR